MNTRTITETIERPDLCLPAVREFFTGQGRVLQTPSHPILRLSREQEERVRMRSDQIDLRAALENLEELLEGLSGREVERWLQDFRRLSPDRFARAVAVLYVRVLIPLDDEALLDQCYKILQLLYKGDVDQYIYGTELGLRIEPLYLEALASLRHESEEHERALDARIHAVNRGVVRAFEVIEENRAEIQREQGAEIEDLAVETEWQRQEILSLAIKIADKTLEGDDPELKKGLVDCRHLLGKII